MLQIVRILTITLVAVAMAPALAHAMEFPGKMRLSREANVTVQLFYFPGFTFAGGVAEVSGLLSSIGLLAITPLGRSFWLTAIAVAGMTGMQAIFWRYTQPVNKLWLHGISMGNLGAGFFDFNPGGDFNSSVDLTGASVDTDWKVLRDRWEKSHMIRTALVFVSFLSLLLGIALND